MNKRKSMFSAEKKAVLRKPQNQISEAIRKSAERKVAEEISGEYVLLPLHANLLASHFVEEAYTERINKTSPSAPDVLLSDADKVESLRMSAMRMLNKLTDAELEQLLDNLVDSYDSYESITQG